MSLFGRFVVLSASACMAVLLPMPVLAQESEEKADSPLVVQPETPTQKVGAIFLLLKLERPDLAKAQVQELVDANLSVDELITIRDAYGTGAFLSLAREPELMPFGGRLLDQIAKAARSVTTAEGYLDELLEGFSGTGDDARASLREIKRMGPDGIIDLVNRAGRNEQMDVTLERVLSLLGSRAVSPLTDVLLDSDNPAQRELAARVLARTASFDQVPSLVAVAANKAEPEILRQQTTRGLERLAATSTLRDSGRYLVRSAEKMLKGTARIGRDAERFVLLYGMVDDKAGLIRLGVPEPQARKILAARLLEAVVQIDSDNRDALRTLYLLRLDLSADDEAASELAQRGLEAASEVLDVALRMNLTRPAVVALNVIAASGNADAFANRSPAARALDSPSDAVQLAAARAAVAVAPRVGFPNSYRVSEILLQHIAGQPSPRAVVIDPNIPRGADVGGRLQQIGFDPVLAATGREGFRQAAARSDIVLALIHANSIEWELTPTIANFAADARTARIPLAIVASTQSRDEFAWLRREYPDLLYVPVLTDTNGMRRSLKPALDQLSSVAAPYASASHREAAALLRTIVEERLTPVFPIVDIDILVGALHDLDLEVADDIAHVLGAIPSVAAQHGLAEITAAVDMDESLRLTAAKALVQSQSRYGSTVTDDLVVAMNASIRSASDELRESITASILNALD